MIGYVAIFYNRFQQLIILQGFRFVNNFLSLYFIFTFIHLFNSHIKPSVDSIDTGIKRNSRSIGQGIFRQYVVYSKHQFGHKVPTEHKELHFTRRRRKEDAQTAKAYQQIFDFKCIFVHSYSLIANSLDYLPKCFGAILHTPLKISSPFYMLCFLVGCGAFPTLNMPAYQPTTIYNRVLTDFKKCWIFSWHKTVVSSSKMKMIRFVANRLKLGKDLCISSHVPIVMHWV